MLILIKISMGQPAGSNKLNNTIILLSITCNYVVSVWVGFRFLSVLRIASVILLSHSPGLYNVEPTLFAV